MGCQVAIDPTDLPTDVLVKLFEAMTDPDAVPARISDPTVRAHLRTLGLGTYVADEAECASRRVDLSEPARVVEEPLPMEEAGEEVEAAAVWLPFRAEDR